MLLDDERADLARGRHREADLARIRLDLDNQRSKDVDAECPPALAVFGVSRHRR